MAVILALNFRAIDAFVTDPSGTQLFGTVGNSVGSAGWGYTTESYVFGPKNLTCGWLGSQACEGSRNRNAYGDGRDRLAGLHRSDANLLTFRADVPNGSYKIGLALGDHDNAVTINCSVRDGDSTQLFAVSGTLSAADHYYDAKNNERTSAQNWLDNFSAGLSDAVSITQGYMTLYFSSTTSPICHLYVEEAGGGLTQDQEWPAIYQIAASSSGMVGTITR